MTKGCKRTRRDSTIFLPYFPSSRKRMIKYLRIRLMLSAPHSYFWIYFYCLFCSGQKGGITSWWVGKKIGSKILTFNDRKKYFRGFLSKNRKSCMMIGVAMCFICIPFLLKDNPDTSFLLGFLKQYYSFIVVKSRWDKLKSVSLHSLRK